MNLWRRLIGPLSFFMLIVIAESSGAAFRPRVDMDLSGGYGTIIINGQPAVRFQSGNGDLTPVQRAEITADRVRTLVAQGVDPNTIYAKGDANQGRVYAGETMICIATAADAAANSATPLALANSWAGRIKNLLLMPPVTLSTKNLTVPVAENRRVDVGGAAIGMIAVRVGSPAVASAVVGADGRYLQVTGISVGDTVIEVNVDGERAAVRVSVRKYAGYVSGPLTARVTGNPCPASLLKYIAKQTISQGVRAESGAKWEVEDIDCPSGGLSTGKSCRVGVTVRITGDNYIPVSAKASVEVQNTSLPQEKLDQLFYSNDPEMLKKYQTLFAGKLEIDKSTRILYHHQNMMGKKAHLIIELINPNPTPATYRIFGGMSDPHVDTVLVGYVATLEFLREQANNVSVIETVPPQSRLVLVSDMMEHMQTSSGIIQVRQMEGSSSYLRITDAEPYVDNVFKGTIAASSNALMMKMSDQVYPQPSKVIEADYAVGGRWAFIPIGKHAVEDSSAQKKLYGNYGVTYTINVKMENPTPETKKVNILFDPTAGLAGGVFIIDGKFVSTKYAKPPTEYPLASYDLAPGETRTVQITTIPLAGSNYPANLVVRS